MIYFILCVFYINIYFKIINLFFHIVCDIHCKVCTINGYGKCDSAQCDSYYGYNPTTKVCEGINQLN